MELFKICDVMSSPVITINIEENVSRLAKMLLSNRHSGFPVVKYDRETKSDVAYGLVTRYGRDYSYQVRAGLVTRYGLDYKCACAEAEKREARIYSALVVMEFQL